MNGTFPRYLRVLLAMTLGSLSLVAAVNAFADPYGSFHVIPHDPLRPYAAGMGLHAGKAEMIARADWDVMLLGTSRVQTALDPAHPALAGQRAYNAGLYGADFPELDRAARLAMRKGRLKRLILCVDLFSFDPDWRPGTEWQQSLLNPDLNHIDYRLSNLLSLSATELSFQTLQNWRHHVAESNYPLGLRTTVAAGHEEYRSDWVLGGYFELTVPPAAEASSNWSPSASRLAALSALLADASRARVRVDLVQLPVHAIGLERYFAVDRWNVYERWLTSLTRIADEHNRAFPDRVIPFWDFSTYNAYTTGLGSERSRWFHDPFHFKVALGNLVLDRLLDFPSPPDEPVTGFGVIVTPQNLRDHLTQLLKDHQAYFDANPEIRRIHQAIHADRLAHPAGAGAGKAPTNTSPIMPGE